MHTWAFPAPVRPGREDDLAAFIEHLHAQADDHRESRQHASVTMERVYLQPTATGSVVVAYVEAERPFNDVWAKYLTSGLKFDAWFLEELAFVHGLDLYDASALPAEPAQLVAYAAPGARANGLAFCVPLLRGKRDAALWFADEIQTARAEDMRASRSALGIVRENVYLVETPAGETITAYFETHDPAAANRAFAASTEPFDLWFKAAVKRFCGVDLGEPLPPIVELLSWSG
jgi:hypothetical protein